MMSNSSLYLLAFLACLIPGCLFFFLMSDSSLMTRILVSLGFTLIAFSSASITLRNKLGKDKNE